MKMKLRFSVIRWYVTVVGLCYLLYSMQVPIVQVHQGQLRGITERNVNRKKFVSFRGVPYAKPPIGELRFKDPEALEPWSGVKDASRFGERCAQQDWFTHGYIGSDDCLNLNIYVACLNPLVKKAVMVWIPGGSFIYGSNKDDLYGPDYLVEKDIVLVVINYRLGILGFLNVDDEEAPGNQGLKDQVQALKWIQQNIAQFGGDPDNVTICGDSAGGASVHYLTISPLAHGLFHKAIIQSGVAASPWASSSKPPMESVKKLAAALNKDIGDVKEFVAYLRTLTTDRLVEAAFELETDQDRILFIHPFVPSVDSRAKHPFLPIPVDEAMKVGIKVPCICGYVSHEGIISVGGMGDDMLNKIGTDPDNLLIHPTVLRYLKTHNVSITDVKQFYFGDKTMTSKNIEKFVELLTDINFIIGLHHAVEIQSNIPDVPIYLYKFEYEPEISLVKKCLGIKLKGACHGEELGLLFYQKLSKFLGKKPPAPGSIEYSLIHKLTELWTDFAKTGNPTPRPTSHSLAWVPVDKSNEYRCLYVTKKPAMGTVMNITQRLCDSKEN